MSDREKAFWSLVLSLLSAMTVVVVAYRLNKQVQRQEEIIAALENDVSEISFRLIAAEQKNRKLDQMNSSLQSIVDEITQGKQR